MWARRSGRRLVRSLLGCVVSGVLDLLERGEGNNKRGGGGATRTDGAGFLEGRDGGVADAGVGG